MGHRNLLLSTALVGSLAAFSLPSYADDEYVNVEPPAYRHEKYEKRAGQVWAPGSWQWRNGKHEWVEGRYMPERKGYRYESDRWVQHDNQQWTYQRGGWMRDERERSPGG